MERVRIMEHDRYKEVKDRVATFKEMRRTHWLLTDVEEELADLLSEVWEALVYLRNAEMERNNASKA